MKQLYHVTMKSSIESIYDTGINPLLAVGKEAKVWVVEQSSLLWAIAHCADRHDVKISEMMVIPVAVPTMAIFAKTKWHGVLTSTFTLLPSHYPTKASTWIERLTPDVAT